MLALASRFRIAVLAFAAAGSIVLGDAAHAASCRAMKAELASLTAKSGGSARYRKAIRRQRGQMRRVELMMSAHSCRARRSGTCTMLRNSFREMERNLRQLRKKGGGSGTANRSKRARLQKRIGARCGATAAKERRKVRAAAKRRGSKRSRRLVRMSTGRTYRTMCVRLCDGLTFPVSLSTAPRQFGADAEACNALCPGTPSRLYAAPARSKGLNDARDVETGEPYPQLSTAYRYRELFDRACSCRFAGQRKLDYGRPIQEAKPEDKAPLRPARKVRVVGRDYFGG